MTKSVTVVIPSRDGRDTLLRAMKSLTSSAAHIAEVILVHSNSPAEYQVFAERELRAFRDCFGIRIIDSGANSNGSIARNVGIAAANGPYLALLDDDDEWAERKLDAYWDFICNQRLTGDFVVFSKVISCREDGTAATLFPLQDYRGGPIAEFILSPAGGAQTSSLLLPSSLAKRIGFDPLLPRHQDYDFCMRLEEAGASFHEITSPMSYWYQRGDNTAKGSTFDFCRNWLAANRHRLSRAAYVSYIEKELLSRTRESGKWMRYARFVSATLSPREQLESFARLGKRFYAMKFSRRQGQRTGAGLGLPLSDGDAARQPRQELTRSS